MIKDKKLQLAIDYIELSIILSPEKHFILPDYGGTDFNIILLNAVEELIKDDKISINLLDNNKKMVKFSITYENTRRNEE